MTTARDILNRHMTEADLQQSVVELALRTGWLCMHIPDKLYKLAAKEQRWDAMLGAEHFPDLVCIHPQTGRLAVLECKTERGSVDAGQREWLEAFEAVFFEIACAVVPEFRAMETLGHRLFPSRILIDVVRPRDFGRVAAFLTGDESYAE